MREQLEWQKLAYETIESSLQADISNLKNELLDLRVEVCRIANMSQNGFREDSAIAIEALAAKLVNQEYAESTPTQS